MVLSGVTQQDIVCERQYPALGPWNILESSHSSRELYEAKHELLCHPQRVSKPGEDWSRHI